MICPAINIGQEYEAFILEMAKVGWTTISEGLERALIFAAADGMAF